MADGGFLQAWDMKIGRLRKSALDDHPIALARAPMTYRAINFVTVAPSLESLPRNGKRKRLDEVSAFASAIEMVIVVELSVRDGVRRDRSRDAAVGEESGFFHGSILRMIEHAAAATDTKQKQQAKREQVQPRARPIIPSPYVHDATSVTASASRLSRKRRVFWASNLGSVDSTQRKK